MDADDQNEPPLITTEQIAQWLAVAAVIVTAIVVYRLHPRSTLAIEGNGSHWDAVIEQSRAAHRPTLVLFTADWCPACSALHSQVLSMPAIQDEINDHYIMTTVDLTSPSYLASERARNYGVSAIPTLIRFDADGKETDRTHYIPASKMIDWLRDGEQ